MRKFCPECGRRIEHCQGVEECASFVNFIEVKEVNPAYTSIIGSIKYSGRSRIDVHHGAAMCIGRKGLFSTYGKNKKKKS